MPHMGRFGTKKNLCLYLFIIIITIKKIEKSENVIRLLSLLRCLYMPSSQAAHECLNLSYIVHLSQNDLPTDYSDAK